MGQQGKAITLLVPADLPKWRRMARNLGQAVALQRLAIEEEPIITAPPTRPETSVTQDHKPNSERQPIPDHKHFAPDQEHRKLAQPKHDGYTTPGIKRRPKDSPTSETPVSQPEGFTLPERPYPSKVRDGGRSASKQSSVGRTTGKHNAHSFAATEPPQRPSGRQPIVKLAKRARRAAASNRSADR